MPSLPPRSSPLLNRHVWAASFQVKRRNLARPRDISWNIELMRSAVVLRGRHDDDTGGWTSGRVWRHPTRLSQVEDHRTCKRKGRIEMSPAHCCCLAMLLHVAQGALNPSINPSAKLLASASSTVADRKSPGSFLARGKVLAWLNDGDYTPLLKGLTAPAASLATAPTATAVLPAVGGKLRQAQQSPQTQEVAKAVDHADGDAAALAFALSCELSGPIATALVLVAAVLELASPADATLSQALASGSVESQLGAAWVGVEAFFYLVSHIVARAASDEFGPVPFAYTSRGGLALWRRILNDPSQHPKDLVGAWMYPADAKRPSSATLLAKWARARLGFELSPPSAALSAAAASSTLGTVVPTRMPGQGAPRGAPSSEGGGKSAAAKAAKAAKAAGGEAKAGARPGTQLSLTAAAAHFMKPVAKYDFGIDYDLLSHGDVRCRPRPSRLRSSLNPSPTPHHRAIPTL